MASEPLQPGKPVLRIVLLGKTGVGKSASGNTILGKSDDGFEVKQSPSSVTAKSLKKTREFNGQTMAVVDTPGLFHTEKTDKEVAEDILDCMRLIMPGPHVFLLVLRIGKPEDETALKVFQRVFQKAKSHTIILFTHGDQCGDQEASINKDLKNRLDEYCEAYHVFNNNDTDDSQVTGLVEKINKMVEKNKNEEKYYKNEMFEAAQEALEEMMKAEMKMKDDTDVVEQFISVCKDLLKKQVPVHYKYLEKFLNKVVDMAMKCMPGKSD